MNDKEASAAVLLKTPAIESVVPSNIRFSLLISIHLHVASVVGVLGVQHLQIKSFLLSSGEKELNIIQDSIMIECDQDPRG